MPNLYKYKASLHSSSNCTLVILYFLACERDLEGVYCLSRRRVVMHTKVVGATLAGYRREAKAGAATKPGGGCAAMAVVVLSNMLQAWLLDCGFYCSSVVRQAGFALNINDSCCDGRQLRLTVTSVAAQLKPRCCVSDSGSVAFLPITKFVSAFVLVRWFQSVQEEIRG
ncbi:unnamed protein product [Prunus armeniaca]